MLILWEHFKTKNLKIGPIERMLHCVKIDKLKKMTLYSKVLYPNLLLSNNAVDSTWSTFLEESRLWANCEEVILSSLVESNFEKIGSGNYTSFSRYAYLNFMKSFSR